MSDTVQSRAAAPLLIEAALPDADVQIARHRIVHAPPAATLAGVRSLDFLDVRTPLLDAAMWARGLPARLSGDTPPVPPSMRLGDAFDSGDMGLPGWLVLGESDHELAFGAVGRFWKPDIEWLDVAAEDFPGFAEPGWGKIAAGFSVQPYGAGGSLLTYDCRVACTDRASRDRFRRYWWLVRPFVGHILAATVATIAAEVEGS
jgi:hypothetical protein